MPRALLPAPPPSLLPGRRKTPAFLYRVVPKEVPISVQFQLRIIVCLVPNEMVHEVVRTVFLMSVFGWDLELAMRNIR